MKKNPIETLMGLAVIIVALFFVNFAREKLDTRQRDGYEVSAKFLKIGGLEDGSDVRISGVKVGSVVSNKLNMDDYTATVVISLKPDIKIPEDTSISIEADGIMGGKFVKLEPGHSKTMLPPHGVLKKVKGFRSLEDMVGELVFSSTN